MADNEALFTPELVFFDWECATPDEVFARLEGELAPRGYIASGWLDAVRTREDAYPTGLAMPAANIAIPHTEKQREESRPKNKSEKKLLQSPNGTAYFSPSKYRTTSTVIFEIPILNPGKINPRDTRLSM